MSTKLNDLLVVQKGIELVQPTTLEEPTTSNGLMLYIGTDGKLKTKKQGETETSGIPPTFAQCNFSRDLDNKYRWKQGADSNTWYEFDEFENFISSGMTTATNGITIPETGYYEVSVDAVVNIRGSPQQISVGVGCDGNAPMTDLTFFEEQDGQNSTPNKMSYNTVKQLTQGCRLNVFFKWTTDVVEQENIWIWRFNFIIKKL